MTEHSHGRRPGCARCGCFACAALVLLPIVLLVVLAGVAVLLGPLEERIERPRLTREVPRAVSPARPDEGAATDFSLPPDETGHVVLDVSMAQLEVVPGKPGEPIRVEGEYDAGAFELSESLEPRGELGWVYRLTFGRRVSWLRLFGEHENRIRLVLPPDAPFALEGAIGVGESKIELGGLWVTEADLRVGVGDHAIRFSEPLPVPMQRLEINGSMGELRLGRVGNASPATLVTAHGIGAFELDLRGDWKTDAEIDTRCGIGECSVRLPREVNVELENADLLIGEVDTGDVRRRGDPDDDWPTLQVKLNSRIGELSVRR